MKAFIFEHPVNQLTEKYFIHLKTKNFTKMKSALAARVNLVAQVAKVVNFSCWLRRSGIRTEAHKKMLASSASKGTSLHSNREIRENSSVYFLFFRIYFLFL